MRYTGRFRRIAADQTDESRACVKTNVFGGTGAPWTSSVPAGRKCWRLESIAVDAGGVCSSGSVLCRRGGALRGQVVTVRGCARTARQPSPSLGQPRGPAHLHCEGRGPRCMASVRRGTCAAGIARRARVCVGVLGCGWGGRGKAIVSATHDGSEVPRQTRETTVMPRWKRTDQVSEELVTPQRLWRPCWKCLCRIEEVHNAPAYTDSPSHRPEAAYAEVHPATTRQWQRVSRGVRSRGQLSSRSAGPTYAIAEGSRSRSCGRKESFEEQQEDAQERQGVLHYATALVLVVRCRASSVV